jgi:hypothetical protein
MLPCLTQYISVLNICPSQFMIVFLFILPQNGASVWIKFNYDMVGAVSYPSFDLLPF